MCKCVCFFFVCGLKMTQVNVIASQELWGSGGDGAGEEGSREKEG